MTQARLLILGPPGAGKGTQSKNIADAFDVEHVTTGDALRANKQMDISEYDLEYDTPAGYMDAGDLVPDVVVNAMVEKALADADGFILDGYPRNLDQAKELENMTDLDVILSLDVSREELIDRLTGRRVCDECGATFHVKFNPPKEEGVCDDCGGELIQREDDTEDTVRERLRVYRENTEPVVEHYRDEGVLVEVSGEGTPDDVFENLRDVVEN